MKRLNDHNPKKAKDMTRTELIYELSRHCHNSFYHKVIIWQTESMRQLLEYYRKPEPKGMHAMIVDANGLPHSNWGMVIEDDADIDWDRINPLRDSKEYLGIDFAKAFKIDVSGTNGKKI